MRNSALHVLSIIALKIIQLTILMIINEEKWIESIIRYPKEYLSSLTNIKINIFTKIFISLINVSLAGAVGLADRTIRPN